MKKKPIDVWCPACQSEAGEPCTQPNDRGRHPVKFTHYVRDAAAEEPSHADQVMAAITERARVERELRTPYEWR